MSSFTSSITRTVRINGRELEVRARQQGNSWQIDAGDGVREASVVEVEPRVYSVLLGSFSFEVRPSVCNSECHVVVEDPREPRASQGPAGLEGRQTVKAPMPGKVIRVIAAEGDTVERGQGLIVIEAMKMQNELKAPKTGVVVSIGAREGDAVAAGQVLALVE